MQAGGREPGRCGPGRWPRPAGWWRCCGSGRQAGWCDGPQPPAACCLLGLETSPIIDRSCCPSCIPSVSAYIHKMPSASVPRVHHAGDQLVWACRVGRAAGSRGCVCLRAVLCRRPTHAVLRARLALPRPCLAWCHVIPSSALALHCSAPYCFTVRVLSARLSPAMHRPFSVLNGNIGSNTNPAPSVTNPAHQHYFSCCSLAAAAIGCSDLNHAAAVW